MVKDQVFALRDGFYCIVDGRVFGAWDTLALAKGGMAVEQRRAATRLSTEPVCGDCEGTRVQDQDYVAGRPCANCNGKGTITQHMHLRTVTAGKGATR
jgi:hypothetical protein